MKTNVRRALFLRNCPGGLQHHATLREWDSPEPLQGPQPASCHTASPSCYALSSSCCILVWQQRGLCLLQYPTASSQAPHI